MFQNKILIFVVFFAIAAKVNSNRVTIDAFLRKFLGTLEQYANTPNEVVFLLDESGSIGAERFPHVLEFTKLSAQRFSVSEEHTRIAVVTFATDTVTHIDYIKDPKQHNMCTLLKKIDEIGYAAQWTHTDKAMRAAEDILKNSRPNANKIIVLLTDGQSNEGHSPVAISQDLKRKGIIIFAVGVAEVNVEEINAVASSPEHVYILSDFDYIKQVNKYLVNDTKEVWMDLVRGTSLCDSFCSDGADCCDVHANCYCGTRSGRYECACIAGYYGNGHRGECHKCPRGTYKSVARNSECKACPEHSTTVKEGSTSFSECVCDSGYERIGNFCIAVKCASLSAPEGGILIPSHCNNTYETQCSLKCRVGYCPFSCKANNHIPHPSTNYVSLPTRTCLETREWSGEEFYCEKMICPALQFPSDGKHNCFNGNFNFGTTCQFTCDKGFKLQGSDHRTCLLNGSWTGQETRCERIQCDPLKTNKFLRVKPKDCGVQKKPFESFCQYHCSNGYSMVSDSNDTSGIMKCEATGKWSGVQNKISCKDVTPPEIFCPPSNETFAEPHKWFAQVSWNLPHAKDNIAIKSISIVEPKSIKKPPYNFPIGQTKIVYRAVDVSELSSDCSLNIKVLDKEPPEVIACPSDIEVYHDKNTGIVVKWDEPVFMDNSKKDVKVTSKRKSGDLFAWGPEAHIVYNATDESGNTASCSFTVKVKHYPCPYYAPPANGMVTCDTWADGRICSIYCHEGFVFASSRTTSNIYFCVQVNNGQQIEGRWQSVKGGLLKMPWPDCTKTRKPASLNVTFIGRYPVGSCSEEALQTFKEKFVKDLEDLPGKMFCPRNCIPENVKVSCNPATRRVRRSHSYNTYYQSMNLQSDKYRFNRETPRHVLTVSFNMEMFSNATDLNSDSNSSKDPNTVNEADISSIPLMQDMENKILENVKDAYHLSEVPKSNIHYDVIVMCSVGQIKVNNTCVKCPAGSYKEDVSETCIECPQATYQDEEGRLSCKACPIGYTTYAVKSKSEDECKGPCKSGTYSRTTFEPCIACPLNTYQERPGRKDCRPCSTGLVTLGAGSDSSKDCVAPCKPGSYSNTGFEPCQLCDAHSYQDEEKQTSCYLCPNQTSASVKGSKSIEDCKEIDLCAGQNPCKSGSTCVQLDKEYECVCPDGLEGKHCEINPDDCDSSPCFNNGTCVDRIGNFSCLCLEGWTGNQCQTNIDDCNPNPCQNGGACFDMLNSFVCQCKLGFNGSRCERNIDECESNPCMNNGTCFDKENGYRCCCGKNYYGEQCEKVYDFCDSARCENSGICISSLDGYHCTCPPGFEGKFCERNIDDCEGFLCQNGGVCLDGIENATCICPRKYFGSSCEEELIPEFMISFPTPSTSNFVELKNNRLLYAITVSFFMRTSYQDSNSRATPVSYSYQSKHGVEDNALTLFDTNNIILYIHGEMFHTEYVANRDDLWHHYAVTWEKVKGKWHLYVDGKSVSEGLHVGENKYMHPGIFILGQEQDGLGDSFTTLEAFAGDITEFNVWDYALTAEEIHRVSAACGFVGNVIPWYVASKFTHGNAAVSSEVSKCNDIGHCTENSCDCFYSNHSAESSCKPRIPECNYNICANGQACVSGENYSFCDCSSSFEGRHCEYDVNECLENNGGCQYLCVDEIGSHHCDCPEDTILSEDLRSCIETSFCVIDGNVYPDGETWVSLCRNCICDHGYVQCEEKVCNETACHPEETMITTPGECCPRCVAWSNCRISPNNTVRTFDMSSYQIEGKCVYTAIEDCIGGHFKVQIEPVKNSTQAFNLVIYQDCLKLFMSLDRTVFVDDKAVDLPFKNEEMTVEKDNSSISVWTRSNLHLQWNVNDEVLVDFPVTNLNEACGLCKKIEILSISNTGRYNLPERSASGEKKCFAIFEDHQIQSANQPASAGYSCSYSSCLLSYLYIFFIMHILL